LVNRENIPRHCALARSVVPRNICVRLDIYVIKQAIRNLLDREEDR